MLYYQHKETGKIIGSLHSWHDKINAKGEFDGVITQIVMPDVQLGNGIICHLMDYRDLQKGYKRISKKIALEKYPDFGQLRHVDDMHNKSITYTAQRYLDELKPIREKGFGNSFKNCFKPLNNAKEN